MIRYFIIGALLAAGFSETYAQDSTALNRFEVQAQVSYENEEWNYPDRKENQQRQVLSFLPSAGWFVTSNLEVMLGMHYNLLKARSVGPSGYVNEGSYYTFGVQGGELYHVPIVRGARLFGGLQFGTDWRPSVTELDMRFLADDRYEYREDLWFPIITGGVKLSLSPRWSYLFQVEYRNIHPQWNNNIEDYISDERVIFSTGFAVYFR